MPLGWVAAAAGIYGAFTSADAAHEQAQDQNEATQRQYQYDMDLWEANKDKLDADWQYAWDTIATQERNEKTLAQYQNFVNAAQYAHQLQINAASDAANQSAYNKSNNLFQEQISLNAANAGAARDDELRSLQESITEGAFENQDIIIKNLLARDAARAKGVTGRSADKVTQSILMERGRGQTAIAESLMGAKRNTRSVLQEISRDHFASDLSAFAAKMIKPAKSIDPIQPFDTPIAEFIYPREIEEFDYGPEPVMGAHFSASAAANAAWASGITGIAAAALHGLIK